MCEDEERRSQREDLEWAREVIEEADETTDEMEVVGLIALYNLLRLARDDQPVRIGEREDKARADRLHVIGKAGGRADARLHHRGDRGEGESYNFV